MFASTDCLKDCASLYDELCLLFRLLFSAFDFCQCSWGNLPGCVDGSSRPLRRLRDGDVTEESEYKTFFVIFLGMVCLFLNFFISFVYIFLVL